MIYTRVSCCHVCSCITKFTYHLISFVSFKVTVPINHCSASPKKGSRLLLGHWLLAVGNLLRMGSVLSSCIAIHMVGSYD